MAYISLWTECHSRPPILVNRSKLRQNRDSKIFPRKPTVQDVWSGSRVVMVLPEDGLQQWLREKMLPRVMGLHGSFRSEYKFSSATNITTPPAEETKQAEELRKDIFRYYKTDVSSSQLRDKAHISNQVHCRSSQFHRRLSALKIYCWSSLTGDPSKITV